MGSISTTGSFQAITGPDSGNLEKVWRSFRIDAGLKLVGASASGATGHNGRFCSGRQMDQTLVPLLTEWYINRKTSWRPSLGERFFGCVKLREDRREQEGLALGADAIK